MQTDEHEEWRDIPFLEGMYQASSLGRVRSVDRIVRRKDGLPQRRKGKMLTPTLNKNTGHLAVGVPNVGPWRGVAGVHRLVCAAFHGTPPQGHRHDSQREDICAHGDGNPQNNRPENLRWATRSENAFDCHKHGTALIGERHPRSKITEQIARQIRERHAAGERAAQIAADFGISRSRVYAVTSGRCW
jgi:hypothetical protein